MTESDRPTSGDDDWGGPEETPWQREPSPPPGQPEPPPRQPPEQPPQYGGPPPPQYGQQPPYGGAQYGQQPQYGGGQYGGPPPQQPAGQKLPNYLVHNIVATVLCCLPAGIVGIVYASQVNGKQAAGDYAGAKKASDSARMWFIIALIAGAVVGVIYLIAVTSQGTV